MISPLAIALLRADRDAYQTPPGTTGSHPRDPKHPAMLAARLRGEWQRAGCPIEVPDPPDSSLPTLLPGSPATLPAPHPSSPSPILAPRSCGCGPFESWQLCGWVQFIQSLPPDDPVRLRDEAGDPNQDWADPRWSGEGCRCACHDDLPLSPEEPDAPLP